MTIKRPSSISPKERRQDKQIGFMAARIPNQAVLDALLLNSSPAMRTLMMERLKPFLRFVPKEEVIADCPNRGLRRGSAVSHECVAH